MVNYTQIAANWATLTDGSLDAKLNLTEVGTEFPDTPPQVTWTLALINGTAGAGGPITGNCLNWMSAASNQDGNLGRSRETNGQWTNLAATSSCHVDEAAGAGRRLYCFQQD